MARPLQSNERRRRLVAFEPQTDFERLFCENHSNRTRILDLYREAVGKPPEFGKITKQDLWNFVAHLRAVLAPNSAKLYAAVFKSFLNKFEDNPDVQSMRTLSLRKDKVIKVYLTEDELDKIRAFQTRNKNELYVRCRFLIGAYTGARHSDFSELDMRNMENGFIRYVSKKTHTEAIVPFKPVVRDLLLSCPEIDISDPTFNNTLRRICRDAGITSKVKIYSAGEFKEGEKCDFVSSHTARRSFATNLYLRHADIFSIMKMLGHADVQMTVENYICCGLRPQSEEVMGYFD